MKAGIVVNLVCVSVVLGLAEVPEPATPEYAPNELIVKFSDSVADSVEKQLGPKQSVRGVRLSANLDELNARYGLREMKAVFKNFKKHRRRMDALVKKDTRVLTGKEEHILRRLKRAPKGAQVPDLSRIYRLELDLGPGQSVEEAVAAYDRAADVEYAELNYVVSIDLRPNDRRYSIQWPLDNTGQMYPDSGHYNDPPGTPDCDIDAPLAWSRHTGSGGITIAVVDTGVDYNHRDLQGNMWINGVERYGTTGVDDDENGYVDDVYGYDFCTLEQEQDSDPIDDHGHGTHCAGVIAARGNNGLDIAGVCWQSKIMALKFLSSGGSGYTDDAVEAFYYAVANGANVTSNSWGGGGYSLVMSDAIAYAFSQGVIMVAAAGNSDSSTPPFPAYYDHMVSVAATDSDDRKASFSNYGDWVDLAAPGVDILSLRASGTSMGTVYDGYTTIASGTSMACPHVAGVYALLLSSSGWNAELVKGHVIRSADALSDGRLGKGRLNAHRALTMSPGVELVYKDFEVDDSLGDNDGEVDPNETFYLNVKIKSDWGPASGVWAHLSSESPWVQIIDNDAFYGSISSQEETWASEPFVISAGPNCPATSAIPFAVTVYADGGYAEEYSFYVFPKKEWVHEGPIFTGHSPWFREAAVDDQGIIYACTGTGWGHMVPDDERDGIHRGTRGLDGTVRWERLGPSNGLPGLYTGEHIAVGGDGVVYAGIGPNSAEYYSGEGFIYRSMDYGHTWAEILELPVSRPKRTEKIVCHPLDPNTLYLFARWSKVESYGRVYVSSGGAPWEPLGVITRPVRDFAIDREDPNVFHASGYANEIPYYFKSTDAGLSWTHKQIPYYDKVAASVSAIGDTVYVTLSDCPCGCGCGPICKSIDGGETWTLFESRGSRVHIDARNSEILYILAGGNGVYKSFDGGQTCIPINSGWHPRYGVGIAEEPSYPYRIHVASQSTGVHSYNTEPRITAPVIEAAPYEIQILCLLDRGNPDSQILSIRNAGSETLVWEITGGCPWLEFGPVGGESTGEVDEVVVSADIAGLGPGIYRCPLTIWAERAINSPRLLNLVVRVLGPSLELTANDFEFQGGKEVPIPESQSLSISNGGGASVNWEIGVPDDCNWLQVRPATGQCIDEINEVKLSVDTNGLDYGSYSCQLTVSAPDAENSPQTVQVKLDLVGPRLAVEPDAFEFWACDEGPNPPGQILSVRNAGFDRLNWQAEHYCPWLSVSPIAGMSTGESDEVAVSVDVTGMARGVHECFLGVFAGEAEEGSQILPVNFIVHRQLRVPTVDYPTIQSAIDAAQDRDVVVVADGTYTGPGNRDLDFEAKAITVRSENGPENCIINCQGTPGEPHRAFYFHSAEGADSVVEGFTITNGYSRFGGAIANEDSSPTVSNCVLRQNTAEWYGGAIDNLNASPRLSNCVFSGNRALDWSCGGAVDNAGSSATIINCTFHGNSADSGGAIHAYDSLVMVENCILWGNIASDGPQICGDCAVSCCDVEGGYSGAGNIDADPLFADAGSGDYHLSPGSAAIDAGNPGSDWSNERWPNGFRVNMGAYGNTSEATRSAAGFEDLAVLSCYWLTDEPLVDIAPEPDGDGIANFLDFAVFADYWRWEQ